MLFKPAQAPRLKIETAGVDAVTVSESAARSKDGTLELQRAGALLDLGRHEEASRLIAGVIGRQPDDPRAWRAMARARLVGGDVTGALAAARSAIGLDPTHASAYVVAAACLTQLGEAKQAVPMAREAVRLAPDSWGAHATLGAALAHPASRLGRRRRHREAATAGARAVTLAPHSSDAQAAWGSVAMAVGKRREAQAAFNQALWLDPQNSVAHNELARLTWAGRRFSPQRLAAAAGGFSTAVRADPAAQASQANVKAVMHSAISITAYLVFLIAWLLRPNDNADGATWRLVPVLALAVPAYFGWRFWHGLTPALRDYLRYVVTRSELRGSCALAAAAVACMLAGAVAPHGARQVLTSSAVLLALAARIWLGVRSPRRADGSHPLIRMKILWVLVALVGGSAVIVAVAAVAGPDRGPQLVTAAVLTAITVGLLWLIRRRRG
jgi:tetratricopeptide (TPR) repeat protein